MKTERIKVWDLPTRVFHWLLVTLIVAAVATGKIGGSAIEWHGKIGLSILGLIVFRLVWGLVGSSHARFANFIPSPSSIRAYLRGSWTGVGHNPLGALSVLALLALIGIQVGTGLFSTDDIAFQGPLSRLAEKTTSDWLTGLHKLSINLLFAVIALHVGAIAFYAKVKKEDLVKPMFTGWKDVPAGRGAPATGGGEIAIVIALLIAVGAMYAASGQWLEHPQTDVEKTTSAPAW